MDAGSGVGFERFYIYTGVFLTNQGVYTVFLSRSFRY